MAPASKDPLEIRALVKIMDELDYYQLLGVQLDATSSQIRQAFHESSRSYHPDANRELDADLQSQCAQISKLVTEAYCILRDARRRKAYDSRVAGGESVRIQLAEARNAHAEQSTAERRGRTAQGRQYHGKAEAELKRGNLAGAIQHIQMALTFEADNTGFKNLLEELRARHKQSA